MIFWVMNKPTPRAYAMKICLIQPQNSRYQIDAEQHWELSRPFSLFYLAAYIEQAGRHTALIIDLEHKKYEEHSLESIFFDVDADIFGITATTFSRFEAIRIATILKALHPSKPIVVGGVHFMYCADDTLSNVAAIDIVVRGEGEVTLLDLLDTMSHGRGLHNVKGISYRGSDNIIFTTQDQTEIADLDNLPYYRKFTWEEYPEYLFGYPEKIPALSIMSSRGCPFTCVFCSKAGSSYRLRSAKSIVDEIEELKSHFQVTGFNFLDLTFTANSRHVRNICEELLRRQTNILWWAESRVNINLDLIPLMKEAGCASLAIGIESGSPTILKSISKGIKREQVINFCKKCHETGIVVTPYYMYSHPGETIDHVRETLDLIDELESIAIPTSFQPSMIFPGTQLEVIARQQRIIPADFSWCTPYESDLNRQLGQAVNIPLFMDKLSAEDLLKIQSMRLDQMVKHDAARAAQKGFIELLRRTVLSLRRGKVPLRYFFSPAVYEKVLPALTKSTKLGS